MAWASQFESSAADYVQMGLYLDDLLINQPNTTKIYSVQGDDLVCRGLHDQDLILANSALTPAHGDIILCRLDGEEFCSILNKQNQTLETPNSESIQINPESDFIILGVVYSSIRMFKPLNQ